jgi:hypothetical protein
MVLALALLPAMAGVARVRTIPTPGPPQPTAAGMASPDPSTPPGTITRLTALSPDDLRAHQPNELGPIPVIEYHVITTDESEEVDPFVRTAEHMREDLQWLYDHGF